MKNRNIKFFLELFIFDNSLTKVVFLLFFAILSQMVFFIGLSYVKVLTILFISTFLAQLIRMKHARENVSKTVLKYLFQITYISLGLFLFFRTRHPYFFIVVSLLTFIIFNYIEKYNFEISYDPINVGIVIGIFLYPINIFHFISKIYFFQAWPFVILLAVGSVITFMNKNSFVILGYLLAILIWSILDSYFFYGNIAYWIYPPLGILGQVFIFLILNSLKFKSATNMKLIFFGIFTGVVNIILKKYEYFYSDQLALFIMITLINSYQVIYSLVIGGFVDKKS